MIESKNRTPATLTAEVRAGFLTVTLRGAHDVTFIRVEDRDPPHGAPRASEFALVQSLFMFHCADGAGCPCLRELWQRYGLPETPIIEDAS